MSKMLKMTVLAMLVLFGCSQKAALPKYSVKMADSEMNYFPKLWTVDNVRIPFWGYTHGIIAKSMLDMYANTGNLKYYDYVEAYADTLVQPGGVVITFDSAKHNIDMINPGKILFPMYEITKDEKYLEAAKTLRTAMLNHPRTSEGGFWHKKVYENQMWLDGLYMGAPFLAQYAREMDEPALFDDVTNQFRLIDKHAYDSVTSLYYHGWDELKSQIWADSVTGTSPNFWGRSVGWFAMALVDALDYYPEQHPGRAELVQILNRTAKGIRHMQDETSGVWYQVLDQGKRAGNYLEATGSSMFVYALYKGVRKGYLDKSYLTVANKGYAGLIKEFIRENPDGTISLTKCCEVAGLGGKNNRDGSFDYYVNEKIRDNDPKGVGPFIWASMEYELLNKK